MGHIVNQLKQGEVAAKAAPEIPRLTWKLENQEALETLSLPLMMTVIKKNCKPTNL